MLVSVVTDLRTLERDAFWIFLDNRGGVTPMIRGGCVAGRRHSEIGRGPGDDPFRSLAGELRKAGGFAKDTTPFSEFLGRLSAPTNKRAAVKRDFDKALGEAMTLAKSQDTRFLPGSCGPLV